MDNRYHKEYVAVKAIHSTNGSCRPMAIKLNDGRKYKIDQLISICRAPSQKVEGRGIRYTISVCGKETYLFDEENGRWFVEYRMT